MLEIYFYCLTKFYFQLHRTKKTEAFDSLECVCVWVGWQKEQPTPSDNLPSWNIDWSINCTMVFACIQFSKCIRAMKLDKLSNHNSHLFFLLFNYNLWARMKFVHYELCFSDERIKMNKHIEKHEKEKNETKSPSLQEQIV